MPVFKLHPSINIFPDPSLAESDMPIAIGGDLSSDRLIAAYKAGIFPWYSEGEPIMWWSPDPRMVLYPSKVRLHKSMRSTFRSKGIKILVNKDFNHVIEACRKVPRKNQSGTWITKEMKRSYIDLHNKGIAHSIEVWDNDQMIGGLYGLSVNQVFSGESMFSNASDASKVALLGLAFVLMEMNYKLIDCQVYSEHLEFMGAEEISRNDYLEILKSNGETEIKNDWSQISEISPGKVLEKFF